MDTKNNGACQACSCPCEAHKTHTCEMKKGAGAQPATMPAGKECPTCQSTDPHKEGHTCGSC